MSNLRHHYFGSMTERFRSEMLAVFGKSKEEVEYVDDYIRKYGDNFRQNFLEPLRNFLDDYHLFITANGQEKFWDYVMDRYNLRQYIIYDSGKVWNINYSSKEFGPRIQAFVLKFPADYKIEIREMTEEGKLK